MDVPCRSCGVPLPDDARFCGACGAPLVAPAADPPPEAIAGIALRRFLRTSGVGALYEVGEARSFLEVLPAHLPGLAIGRLEDEVRAQAQLDHPGLAPYREIVVRPPTTALVSDFVPGAPLSETLGPTPLPYPEVCALAIPILEALAYAHANGVVHGDFGPASVFVVRAGKTPAVRLRGFGVARAIDSPWPTDPSYVAPERLQGSLAHDGRADLYAAAALLHRLVTGRPPFEGSPFEILRGHVEEEPPPLRGFVPPEMDAAIGKALAKDPARRWPDAKSFADALQSAWRAGAAAAESALDRVGRLQRSLADVRAEGDRHRILLEIGDTWRSELELGQKALEAYAAALEARPGDPDAMRRLAAVCTTREDWERAARALERIAARERDPGRRARHRTTLAGVYLDPLGDRDRAAKSYDQALDDSPGELEALEALGKILTEKKDWAALEASYRKMLARIEGEGATALEILLWNLLGELYRTWLTNPDAAAEAYAAAAALDPTKTQPRARLADLYAALPGREADAVAEHETLLERDPLRVDSYRALFDFHLRVGSIDGAWCAAAALAFLEKANDREREIFDRFRPRAALRPRARLDDERWIRWLYHPDEDALLGKILGAVTGALRATQMRPIGAYGLRADQRSDPRADTVALSRTFGWVAPTLGLPTPDLYLQPERAGRLAYAISEPPASVAGADLLSGHSPQELAFAVARHLAYYRGEHYARRILPKPDDLRALVLAALRLGAGLEPPADSRVQANKLADALTQSRVPIAMDLLRAACKKLLEADRPVDVDRFVRAVDLTASRAGFLLTADLATAARAIDSDASTDVPPREHVKELLRFCASSRHVKLREYLGVGVG